ncbi:hypothetical protein [Streptosporangium sp. NPDC000396]|uniref:hypothetical protein n=1 Tax=Streptosporangium sp. NPDC000396 TaxID=3366185 RepID=UPI00367A49C4
MAATGVLRGRQQRALDSPAREPLLEPPDIAWLPIHDMTALDYGLTWRGEAENDMIRAFAQVVRDLDTL